jgi:integrase
MRSSKKRPALGDIGQILTTWAQGWPPNTANRQVALELTAEIGHLQPRQLSSFIAEAFFAKWRTRYSPMTLYTRRAIYQRLLGVLTQYGAPPIKLSKVRKPEPRGVTATQEEIQKLLGAATPALRLFIILCWQLALRRSEALAVTPLSYDDKTHTVCIRTKGGKMRRIPLTSDAEEMIRVASKSAADPSESCVSILNGRPMKRMDKRWWQLTKKCNLTHIHPHDLRRTTATNLYRTTHDIRAVQQYLGHTQLVSTTHYLAPLSEEQLRGMHQLLNFHGKGAPN